MRTSSQLRRLTLRPAQDAGRPVVFALAGIMIQFGWLVVMAMPWMLFRPAGPTLKLLTALFSLTIIAFFAPWLSAAHRKRFDAILGVDIPETAPEKRPFGIGSQAGWRQICYHLLAGPLIAAGSALTTTLAAIAIVAATFYLWVWPAGFLFTLPHDYDIHSGKGFYITALGIAGFCCSVALFSALARADTYTGRRLLGPSQEELLTRRVTNLTESRASVVEAADAERRRIERDLHDGAQQRLVSLAVNLGLAKSTLTHLPDEALNVIGDAHSEAKEAINELSNLVRGLHPPVLEDRGLDAALSGVAARTPLPVKLEVDLSRRLPPAIEAVAYFAVSEALANIVKHSRASRAEITIRYRGGKLRITVSDDGIGGADASGGTGLSGLAKRVASVDGHMSVSSPAGGPTVLTVELPCAL